MVDDDAMLGVDFAIDLHDAFGQLRRLEEVMGDAQVKVYREFKKMEAAAKGVNLSGSVGEIAAMDRELAKLQRTNLQVERSAEALVSKLERQAETFGKSRQELQQMRIASDLTATAERGLVDVNERLQAAQAALAAKHRDAALAAAQEAQELRAAANAHALFEAKVREGSLAMQAAAAARRASAASAAQEQAELARMAGALRGQLDPMFAAQERFNTALDQADRLYQAGAISTREYGAAQQMAREALQQHARTVAGNSAALDDLAPRQRQATGNARQFTLQMSQVSQQVMAGTGIIQAFAMQLPDIAAGMNANTAGASKFATFLGGPWGIAVTAAIGLAATFGMKMLETDDAAKKAAKGQRTFVEVMNDSKASYEDVIKAAKDYADAQERARQTTLQTIQAEALSIKTRIDKTLETRKALDAELQLAAAEVKRVQEQARSPNAAKDGFGTFDALASGRALVDIQEKIAKNQALLNELQRGSGEIVIKTAAAIAEINVDPAARIRAGYDELERQAKAKYKSVGELTARLSELGKAEQEALERQSRANRKHSDETIRLAKVTGDEIAKALGTTITSGYRSPKKNLDVGGGKNSYHLLGQAIDIPLTVNGNTNARWD